MTKFRCSRTHAWRACAHTQHSGYTAQHSTAQHTAQHWTQHTTHHTVHSIHSTQPDTAETAHSTQHTQHIQHNTHNIHNAHNVHTQHASTTPSSSAPHHSQHTAKLHEGLHEGLGGCIHSCGNQSNWDHRCRTAHLRLCRRSISLSAMKETRRGRPAPSRPQEHNLQKCEFDGMSPCVGVEPPVTQLQLHNMGQAAKPWATP